MTSPFYEDDEEDDRDSPPEAVTPPQHHAHPHMPLSSSMTSAEHYHDNHHIPHSYKQGRSTSTTSTTIAGSTRAPSNTTTLKGTDFGSELDTAHKLELDSEDVFESDHHVRSPPSASASSAALYGAPLGRRASWSPAMATTTGGGGAQYGANASNNASATSGGVLHWINGQQQHTTYPVSASAHSNNNNNNSQNSAAIGKDQTPDYGSSPIGLFRRLSLSTTRRVSTFALGL